MFKRLITILITVIFLFPVGSSNRILAADYASTSKSAILIECNNRSVLYEKNADEILPMASTTKIMTALTVLDYFTPDSLMEIPREAVGIEGTSACLEAGEIYTLHELLLALLLQSANDAASAIAINTAGSEANFSILMNRKAKSLGLNNTNFENPHGLPSEKHYTTARELAIIASEALKNETFSSIVSTKNARIESESGKTGYFRNHNKLLSIYNGANGVKTGYTKSSGRCLVSSATRNGSTIIAVTLNSHDDWREHTAMLDYGFEQLNQRTN